MSTISDLEAKIRASALTDEYMSDQQLQLFQELLTETYKKNLELIKKGKEEITMPADEADAIDNASIETEMVLKLKIVDRQIKLLSKIDEALAMIEQKTYGYCVETGEPIGIERLILRPTATLCVDAKSIREVEEKDYGPYIDEE